MHSVIVELTIFFRSQICVQYIDLLLTISPIVAIDPPNIMPTPTFQSDKKVAMTIINPHSGLLTNAG